MPIYIDPISAFNGFGNVQEAILTLDATVGSEGGGPAFPPALSLVTPITGPSAFASIPGWLFVAAFVAFLLLVNDRRG